ncbi:hypothetical protein IGB42_01560 [Andreprevotia sp. IGB-42]|uniref:hypothetical protein n=1 Tax=Andreprevotia sp. IGB-42 TaxID=2497473 RepID=UPI001356E398|nr:hypothetical protein [Andreprevotia sp. IGB-42]KAF0813881.1 hypothetical protein IGB42_01560 [Andreprevotia sp. IGB-42]
MMLEIFLGLPLLLLFAALFYWLVLYSPGAQRHWERLPTQHEYHTQHGGLCKQCSTATTLDVGLLGMTDFRRRILCAQCRTPLWRESAQ